jgi:hypothetical protein
MSRWVWYYGLDVARVTKAVHARARHISAQPLTPSVPLSYDLLEEGWSLYHPQQY